MAQSVIVLGLMGNSAQNISSYQVKKVGIDPPVASQKVVLRRGLGWTISKSVVRLLRNDDERHYTEIHFDNPASFESAAEAKTTFDCFTGPRPLRIAILGHGGGEESRLGWESDFKKHGAVDLAKVAAFIADNLASVRDRFTVSEPLKISLLACEGAAWHDPKRAKKGESGAPAFSMAGRLVTMLHKEHGIPTTVSAYWRVTVSSIQEGKRMILKFGEGPPEGLWARALMTLFNTGIAPYSAQGVGASSSSACKAIKWKSRARARTPASSRTTSSSPSSPPCARR